MRLCDMGSSESVGLPSWRACLQRACDLLSSSASLCVVLSERIGCSFLRTQSPGRKGVSRETTRLPSGTSACIGWTSRRTWLWEKMGARAWCALLPGTCSALGPPSWPHCATRSRWKVCAPPSSWFLDVCSFPSFPLSILLFSLSSLLFLPSFHSPCVVFSSLFFAFQFSRFIRCPLCT